MRTSNYNYYHADQLLTGYLACGEETNRLRPAVLIVHDWSGRNEFACKQADRLAQAGYIGLAVDMYGAGRVADRIEDKQALMQPLINDRQLLGARIQAALDAVMAIDGVDTKRIAVMGFCFGGLCALDLARSGANIVGAISVHGLLNKPPHLANQSLKAKILALHGYNDPMVTPADVNAFCEEMTETGASWQVNMYGHTEHAFTNPHAHDNQRGLVYNAQAAERAFHAWMSFLEEVFQSSLKATK